MMAPCLTTYDDTLLACLALFVAYLIYQTLTSLNAPHPPGPRPCPFIYARHQSIHNPSVPGPTGRYRERALPVNPINLVSRIALSGVKAFHFDMLLFFNPTPLFVSLANDRAVSPVESSARDTLPEGDNFAARRIRAEFIHHHKILHLVE
jgi:hypothetical protein